MSLVTFIISTAIAASHHPEAAYRDAWCIGETEVRLANGSRADCLTTNYAVEVERAPKWHEAVGQSLDYSQQTGKKPAILMVIERESDWRYWDKLKPLAQKHHIRMWYITPRRLP